MKVIIDCDGDELELTDEMTDNGYIQIGIYSKGERFESRYTTVHPKELIKALQAFSPI